MQVREIGMHWGLGVAVAAAAAGARFALLAAWEFLFVLLCSLD